MSTEYIECIRQAVKLSRIFFIVNYVHEFPVSEPHFHKISSILNIHLTISRLKKFLKDTYITTITIEYEMLTYYIIENYKCSFFFFCTLKFTLVLLGTLSILNIMNINILHVS